jgi:hypothetical protein
MKKILLLLVLLASVAFADTRKTKAECFVLLQDGQPADSISEVDVRDCHEHAYEAHTSGSGAPGNPCAIAADIYIDTATGKEYFCPSNGGNWTLRVAAGGDTQVLFNDGGIEAGDAGLTYNKTTNVVTVHGGLEIGDGSVAGSGTFYDVGRTNFRRITVPDVLTADWTLKYPNVVASADGIFVWPAPTADVSLGTFVSVSATPGADTIVKAEGDGDFNAGWIPLDASFAWTGDHDFSTGTRGIPRGTTLPGTCAVGDEFMDTDATSGQRHYLCESANTWKLQGDGTSEAAVVMTASEGNYWPFGSLQESAAMTTFDTNQVYVYEVVLPFAFPLKKYAYYVETAESASACNGASEDCLMWFGFWDVDRTTLVASVSTNDFTSTGPKIVTFSSTVTLAAHTPYYLLIGSESATVALSGSGRGLGSRYAGMMNKETTKRVGKCTNTTTGTGSTYALPATCGTVLDQTVMPPSVLLLPGA